MHGVGEDTEDASSRARRGSAAIILSIKGTIQKVGSFPANTSPSKTLIFSFLLSLVIRTLSWNVLKYPNKSNQSVSPVWPQHLPQQVGCRQLPQEFQRHLLFLAALPQRRRPTAARRVAVRSATALGFRRWRRGEFFQPVGAAWRPGSTEISMAWWLKNAEETAQISELEMSL